ncbi:hypothetical protein TELCIR_16822, partial [Teladorsagia circumcincta]
VEVNDSARHLVKTKDLKWDLFPEAKKIAAENSTTFAESPQLLCNAQPQFNENLWAEAKCRSKEDGGKLGVRTHIPTIVHIQMYIEGMSSFRAQTM